MRRLSKTKVLVLGLAVLLLGFIAGMIISMPKNLNADGGTIYAVISYEEMRKQATIHYSMKPSVVDDDKLAEQLRKMLNYFGSKGWKFCAVLDTYEMIIFVK